MMKFIYTISFILFLSSPIKASDQVNLKSTLKNELTKSHHPITYKMANEILFLKLDNINGQICSVYSPTNCMETSIVPSPKIMNIEHTWPQSEGANGEAKSDLHHIFITDSPTNSIRSSLPFCDVVEVKWTNGFSKRGMNQFNEHCFEPPTKHKGNVARSLFYFSLRYDKPIDEHQELFLRKWHHEDPVDPQELNRNLQIEKFQGNLNPFIIDPNLVDSVSDF